MAKKDSPAQSGSDASNDRNFRGDGQGMLNFDDDELGPGRGKLAPPREHLSDRNGPSDSDDGGKKRPS